MNEQQLQEFIDKAIHLDSDGYTRGFGNQARISTVGRLKNVLFRFSGFTGDGRVLYTTIYEGVSESNQHQILLKFDSKRLPVISTSIFPRTEPVYYNFRAEYIPPRDSWYR